MSWQIVTRKLGRTGGIKERTARQREWDREYGEGMWAIGYIIDNKFILQEDALDLNFDRERSLISFMYQPSIYSVHFNVLNYVSPQFIRGRVKTKY